MNPGNASPDSPPETPGIPDSSETVPSQPKKRWQGRLLTICFAVFAFEIGLVLIIFPWQDSWSLNYFQGISPGFEELWDEPSFRGLVSGLGFVNIYIALLQIVRLIRRS